MCEHCGCDAISPIGQLMAEHEQLLDLSGRVRGALRTGDEVTARGLFSLLVAILEPHAAAEERGLFAVMRESEEFRDHVAMLEAEHTHLDARIARAVHAGEDWPAYVIPILDLLFEHVQKEEFGLFPAALATLDPDAWNLIADVRNTDLTA